MILGFSVFSDFFFFFIKNMRWFQPKEKSNTFEGHSEPGGAGQRAFSTVTVAWRRLREGPRPASFPTLPRTPSEPT